MQKAVQFVVLVTACDARVLLEGLHDIGVPGME